LPAREEAVIEFMKERNSAGLRTSRDTAGGAKGYRERIVDITPQENWGGWVKKKRRPHIGAGGRTKEH